VEGGFVGLVDNVDGVDEVDIKNTACAVGQRTVELSKSKFRGATLTDVRDERPYGCMLTKVI